MVKVRTSTNLARFNVRGIGHTLQKLVAGAVDHDAVPVLAQQPAEHQTGEGAELVVGYSRLHVGPLPNARNVLDIAA
jgi:hypothetical protein